MSANISLPPSGKDERGYGVVRATTRKEQALFFLVESLPVSQNPPGSPGTGIGSKELRETRLAANAVGFLSARTRVYTPSMMNLIRVFPSLAIADQ